MRLRYRPSRSAALHGLALTAVAALAAGCGGDASDAGEREIEGATAPPDAPNVIVVMTDDQDVPSMELMPIVQRQLVDRGVEFTNSFVAVSQCCPSRATFVTGQHAHNHKVKAGGPPKGGFSKLNSNNTLAVWLDKAGYETGQFGRYLNYYGEPDKGSDPLEVPRGWDEWHAPVRHTGFQVYDYTLNENGELVTYGDDPADYATDVFARKAVEFIGRSAEEGTPFFAWITPAIPHTEGVLPDEGAVKNPRPAPRDDGALEDVPFPITPSFAEEDVSDKPEVVTRRMKFSGIDEPPPEYEAEFRGRIESLLAVDRLVGQLMRALREAGELDNTYVVFTSDNGYMLGEHGQRGKALAYEESIRVPLVIRGPGLPEGERRENLVQNIDLAPTVVDVTGAEPRRELDGISLIESARGAGADDRDLLIEYFEAPNFAAVRSADGYTYVEYGEGAIELYDLEEDPYQLENVAGDPGYADIQERLAGRLAELRACSGSEECS